LRLQQKMLLACRLAGLVQQGWNGRYGRLGTRVARFLRTTNRVVTHPRIRELVAAAVANSQSRYVITATYIIIIK